MGAILASMPAVETHVVAFNHEEVVDLTEHCTDPVDLLFGVQVGQAAVPFFVRRPVDASPVGGPHPQAGHIGEIRRTDLDHFGSGLAADSWR